MENLKNQNKDQNCDVEEFENSDNIDKSIDKLTEDVTNEKITDNNNYETDEDDNINR